LFSQIFVDVLKVALLIIIAGFGAVAGGFVASKIIVWIFDKIEEEENR